MSLLVRVFELVGLLEDHLVPEASRTDGCAAPFAGANAHTIFQRQHEDLTIADHPCLGRSGGMDNGLDRCLDKGFVHGDFQLELGKEPDMKLGAAINLGVTALAAAAAHVAYGHQVDVTRVQSGLHRFKLLRTDDGDNHFHESILHMCADGGARQLILEEPLQVFTHDRRIAAAEAEAVALHRRDIRINCTEFGRRRRGSDLAQVRPGVDQIAVLHAFNHHGEPPLAIGRNGGSTRLLRLTFRGQLERRSEIEADFAVLAPIQAFAFRPRLQAEAPRHVNDLYQHPGDNKRKDYSHTRRGKLDQHLSDMAVGQFADRVRASRTLLVEYGGAEYAGQKRAKETADTVHAERIERIIVLGELLQANGGIAYQPRQQTDRQSAERRHES